ncbi:cytochrome P450 2D20-like isoform X2 [Peromyscus californicus insignis]|uniref:cytochrome P450 2D20-like isoform X2 n=1 Tax=Peromyscus californicus insignis TaxID=564181 RepID=UPI0022A69A14|nr:cytochrome P450 2D20-like isoform X2 [Peromyscus californicus insignis]
MALLIGAGLWSVVIFTAIFLLLVDLMYRRKFWTARYPPGPVPLPGLGNLLQVDFQNMPYSLYKLRQRYGDVFSLQMAWKPVIVVNGLKAVREVLVNCGEDTSDRPPIPIFNHLGYGHKSKGHPVNPITLLNKGVCNVISSLIYAHRFEYEDPFLNWLLKTLQESFGEDSGFIAEALNAVPVLLRIPGLPGKAFPKVTALVDSLDKMLMEHKASWDPAQPPRDLTDAFLAEMGKAKGNPESSFNDGNLRIVVFDLFTAGMVTTSTTLSWALLLMILHPDVQSRVHQEIDEVIGQGRRPEMADQARMPYTNAVIHEVQRFADIVPVNIPHMTSRDIEVQGFLIPKGTTLIPNLSSVLKDETVWEKPLQFYPEHFLDAQGRFVKHEAFMPFSAGRRACLGEPLARMELFLFFTCLLQRFSFSVPDGQPRPSDHGVYALPVTPIPYELCAVVR